MLNLTDSNFNQEVIKSATPVLVDFWAPWCIEPSAYILTENEEWKSARTIHINEKLKTYSGHDMKGKKVIYSIESSKFGHCKKVVTETGRSLKLTDEHTLFTKDGWKPAQDITPDDDVAVYPTPQPLSAIPRKKCVIVDKKMIQKYSTGSMRVNEYLKTLQSLGILPLNTTHPLLPTIARLAGLLFTDGGLYQGRNHYREMHFSLGTKHDVKTIRHDLMALGFSIHTNEKTSSRTIAGRSFTQHIFRVKCLSTAAWLLFRALGIPEGNKVEQGYNLPKWLFDASPLAQREFLAAYMGGDGPRITMRLRDRSATGKNPYNQLGVNDIEFYKTANHIRDGIAFANDLKILFSSFKVHVKDIFVEDAKFPRHDGTTSSIIHIKFSSHFENIEQLINRIGYRYAFSKDQSSRPVGEFIRRILTRGAEYKSQYDKASGMFARGMSIQAIATQLELSYDTVFGWLKIGKTPRIGYHLLKFPKWHCAMTRGLSGGLVWERIKTIKSCYLRTVQKITVAEHHNFIANGFLVHNCGPCKTMLPIFEEVAEKYKDQPIKFAKINIDENSSTPSQFGVMSIPTFIIFKNGKPFDEFMGIQSKNDLKKKIDALIK